MVGPLQRSPPPPLAPHWWTPDQRFNLLVLIKIKENSRGLTTKGNKYLMNCIRYYLSNIFFCIVPNYIKIIGTLLN
jgi:hypothetical protein